MQVEAKLTGGDRAAQDLIQDLETKVRTAESAEQIACRYYSSAQVLWQLL